MEAYVATARIRSARPRPRRIERTRISGTPPDVGLGWTAERPTELVGRPLDERLADWWSTVSVNLAQTMFFLTDPDSWR